MKRFKVKENSEMMSVQGYVSKSGKLKINLSSINTLLIKEAAKCENYCSDVLYDIETYTNALKERGWNITPESLLIGFRKNGVDSTQVILMKADEKVMYSFPECYSSIWKIDINPIQTCSEGTEVQVAIYSVEYSE